MKQATTHTYFGSSPGVDWNQLVDEAISEAKREHGGGEWKLEGMYEYDREVYDDKGRLVDIEARVVVRQTA